MDLYNSTVRPCVDHMETACQEAKMTGTKVIRVDAEDVAELLRLDPSIKVIHVVRDPRGIMASRYSIHRWSKTRFSDYSYSLCRTMLNDVKVMDTIGQQLPSSVLRIPYEKAATLPYVTTQEIYDHLGLGSIPSEVTNWLRGSTHAVQNSGRYGTARTDSAKHAYSWKHDLSDIQKSQINNLTNCAEVINALGYES